MAFGVRAGRALFADREEAGRLLARELQTVTGLEDALVVGLPRGGVPVAAVVAEVLGAPLDVIAVRKLGVPSYPEVAMGAIGEDGIRVLNDEVVQQAGVTDDEVAAVERRERAELARRVARFRQDRKRTPLSGRVVVIVDDGVATGSTARAACEVARAEGARRIILAVPVAPADWTSRLEGAADEFISVSTPRTFHAVGQFYQRFDATTDGEVIACLARATRRLPPQ